MPQPQSCPFALQLCFFNSSRQSYRFSLPLRFSMGSSAFFKVVGRIHKAMTQSTHLICQYIIYQVLSSIRNPPSHDTPLQHSCLENAMDGGAWWAALHGVTTSQTRLSDFTYTFHFPALEKEMATHSRVLAWRIPGTGEPGGLPSMGSHRVGHD